MEKWKKLLRALGFTEGETAVYLASVSIGAAPVQLIAKQSNISRVTAYAAIQSLVERGLMTSLQKGKKRLFASESPEYLLTFFQNRVKQMSAMMKEMEDRIDELKLLQRGDKPVVRLFEGKDALRAIQMDVIATRPKLIEEFSNLDEFANVYKSEEMVDFYKELDRMKTKTRSWILAKTRDIVAGREKDDVNITALPEDIPNFKGDVFVYGSKVALSTLRGKQISVIIDSPDISDTIRAMFAYMGSLEK